MRKFLTIAALLWSDVCIGHPGRTDSSGGHNDRRNGGYHYHNGASDPQITSPPPKAYAPPTRDTSKVPTPRTTYRTTARTESREQDTREKIAADFKPSNTPFAAIPVKAEVPPVDRERQAQGKLRLGKQMMDLGKSAEAVKWFNDILLLFPETSAAKEAEVLYKKVTGRPFERKES